jgi:hypothetical protein
LRSQDVKKPSTLLKDKVQDFLTRVLERFSLNVYIKRSVQPKELSEKDAVVSKKR